MQPDNTISGNVNTSAEEMSRDRNSETSRLVASGENRINFINLPSYICVVIFFGILLYCCFGSNISVFSFHPILMTIGWLGLMTTAINAVTPGDLLTEWMPIRLRSARHWVIQVLAGLIILIGFIVILSHKINIGKPHFQTYHAKFGLVSFIWMLIVMLGGLGALNSLKLKSIIAPIYMKLIHSTAGIITYTLGAVTIILGLFSDWWSFGEILRYISLILVLFVLLFTTLRPFLKVYFRIKERIENMK